MHRILFILFLLLSYLASGQPFLQELEQFGANPGDLEMVIHSPGLKEDKGNKPLLVALHGCSQNAEKIARRTGWNKLADRKDFYVLYPQQRFWNNPSNCFNWFKEKDTRKGKGELRSIRNMVRTMKERFPIDSSRIYLYGLSAGGAMGTALLAHHPELFQSGAIYAGGPYYGSMNVLKAFEGMGDPEDRSPKEWGMIVKDLHPDEEPTYPRLVAVHGTDDRVVDPANSLELVDQWSWLHGIDPEPDSVVKAYRGAPEFERSSYRNEKGEELIVRYSIKGLGHELAIDPGEGVRQGGETHLLSKDMDFHSTYWIGRELGLFEGE